MEELKDWQAKWIWYKGLEGMGEAAEHELVYFRRSFAVPADQACRMVIHVSADSRYRLYVNGRSVAVGPCKGDGRTHYYETVDVSHLLVPGTNVLAAKVLHYAGGQPWVMGQYGPVSVARSNTGGFLLEGAVTDEQGRELVSVLSDGTWRCFKDEGYRFVPSRLIQWAGGMEDVDGTKLPHGWQSIHYDDGGWSSAVAFYDTRNAYGELTPWQLAPRPIPAMFERLTTFRSITCAEGSVSSDWQRLIDGAAAPRADLVPLRIEPRSRVVVELDAKQLQTGYIELAVSAGTGAAIRILCAECYESEPGDSGKARLKGIRDLAEGGKLVGEYDTYRVAGFGRADGELESYESFWFRTFRYVRLEIDTADEAIDLHQVRYRETAYPLEVQSEFDCSDPDFRKLWQMGIHTLQLCMHETYEDCPYYEQLQYAKDTRLMMLYTYGVTADDRMARRTLFDFHSSMLPSGMLQCRAPSMYRHVIPAFALDWVFMLHEHFDYFGDKELVARYRPTVIALLDWFERRRTPEGIVGMTPPRYWTHFDWVEEWPGGAPPSHRDQPMILHSLMYAAALHKAADLMENTGWREIACEYREKAITVNEAAMRASWSEERKLLRDAPNTDSFSQHPQVWAILSGAVAGEQARELLERALLDASLPVVSLPMSYHMFRAMETVGMYDRTFDYWNRWRTFIPLHLTTFPEMDTDYTRSDCHGWSALPLSEFPGKVLGVSPGAPGYERIRIAPFIGGLTWAKGKAATVRGAVSVDWRLNGDHFDIEIEGPSCIPIDLVLPDGTSRTFAGRGAYSCGITKSSDHLQS